MALESYFGHIVLLGLNWADDMIFRELKNPSPNSSDNFLVQFFTTRDAVQSLSNDHIM